MTAQEKGAHFATAVASIARSPREQQIIDRATALKAAAGAVLTFLNKSGGDWDDLNARHANLALAYACREHFEENDLDTIIDNAEHDLGVGDYAVAVTASQSTEPPCAALFGGVR